MSINNTNYINSSEDEIDFKEIFLAIWNYRYLILLFVLTSSLFSLFYSLSLPNIYKAEAILAPTSNESSSNKAIQSYSGIASLAGIELPSSSNTNKTQEALKKIVSLSFFNESFLPNIHLPDLMALKDWDLETNTLIYDDGIYNLETKTWVRKVKPHKSSKPSTQESYKEFLNLISIKSDNDDGFITLSMKHQSPYIAKQWIELLITDINKYYRVRDKKVSEASINYLNENFSIIGFTEIKQVISQLIKNETQKLTLIEANQDYIFRYIDPPVVEEEKYGPNRLNILMIGTILSLFISIFISLVHYFYNKEK